VVDAIGQIEAKAKAPESTCYPHPRVSAIALIAGGAATQASIRSLRKLGCEPRLEG
jgi:hypothetical protein